MGIRNNPTEDNFNSLRDDNIDPIIISSDDDDNYSDDEVPDGYQVFFRYRNYYVIVKYVFSEFHQILKMKKIQKILKMKTIFWNLIKGKNLSSVRRVRIT